GLAFEGRPRALHRAVDIICGRIRNSCDHVAGGRVTDVKHLAITGLDLAAVDKIAVNFDISGGRFCGDIHGFLPSTITALRFNAGSTRFSVCATWVLMMPRAVLISRRCIASISATCSATSCAGSCPLTLARLTRTNRSACPIRSHNASAMRRLPEACASAEWKARL